MKRYFLFLMCIATMLFLAACGNAPSQPATGSQSVESSVEQSSADMAESKPNTESSEQLDSDLDLSGKTETAAKEESPVAKPSENISAVTSEEKPEISVKPSPTPNPPEVTPPTTEPTTEISESDENAEMKLKIQIGSSSFSATLESNAAADALAELLQTAPVAIAMSDYSGFEKVGALGTSLPTANHQTTTQSGDIVLYNGNQIVIFYGSNSWSYTRLAKIDDRTGWEEALGSGAVTVTFSLE